MSARILKAVLPVKGAAEFTSGGPIEEWLDIAWQQGPEGPALVVWAVTQPFAEGGDPWTHKLWVARTGEEPPAPSVARYIGTAQYQSEEGSPYVVHVYAETAQLVRTLGA